MLCFDFTRGSSRAAMPSVRRLNGDFESYRELAAQDVVGDNVDAAVDTANDEISSQLVEIESRELGQIEHALHRIVKGVYGRCEYCDGKIAEARLNALPYTNSCIDCQRENERTGQSFHVRRSIPSAGTRFTTSRPTTPTATPRSTSATSRWT